MVSNDQGSRFRNVEEWMLICQHRAQLTDSGEASTDTIDLLEAARRYPNLEAAPSSITCSKESCTPRQTNLNSPDSQHVRGKQLPAYPYSKVIVKHHTPHINFTRQDPTF